MISYTFIPTVKQQIHGYSSQYSAHPKRPSSELHGVTQQQQMTAKTPGKWPAYQTPSVIIIFVDLVCMVSFVNLIPKKLQQA
jgi:hypothetical protein